MSKVNISEKILVSVVVATYRREDSLRRALNSLARQTYKNLDVIIVDDNGDFKWNIKVKSVVDEFRNKLDINYIVNESNIGSVLTRNRGILEAKGDYIAFLDDDDLYMPQRIEMQLEDIIAVDADYGITDLYLYNEKNELIDKRIRNYIKNNDEHSLLRYHLLYHMTGTDTFMFKNSYLLKIGGFSGNDVGDEFYLMKDAILGGGKFIYSNQCYIKAYVHSGEENGLSSGDTKIVGENLLFEKKKEYFEYLSKSDIRYIKMRHYAVIAFAELRRKNVRAFIKNAVKSFFIAPLSCINLFFKYR